MERSLNLTFAALADPTRRAILIRLAQGDATVADLGRPFAITQPSISKHLKVLEGAGLVERGRSGPTRPRHLNVTALNEATAWVEHVRSLSNDSFERLDEFLAGTSSQQKRASHGRRGNR
jgi:DNA-binding transcriptional ArsR family regulator